MAKKYKCPYCDQRYIRKDLISHIEKKHESLLPEEYSSERVVYDLVNKKDGHGTCKYCGTNTKWNAKINRYDIICEKPQCKQAAREEYKRNMLRVHGTYNILNDDIQQKKMLANRRISGQYRFTDGGLVPYTGTFEKKCLEFMDKVMRIDSKYIMSPGPSMEYLYEGEKHIYIPDFYLIPWNLIIEVKDGGANPNTKESPGMKSSRERTVEKERVVTDQGIYNYVRLTNNQFQQLLSIIMELKMQLLAGEEGTIVRVHESSHVESVKKLEMMAENALYEKYSYLNDIL